MVRIVICTESKAGGLRLREAIETFAARRGIVNTSILVLKSREELAALLMRVRPNLFDMAICNMDGRCSEMSLTEISEAAMKVRSLSPQTRFVFMSSNAEHALCAYNANGQFLLLPLEQDDFARVFGNALDEMKRAKRHMLAFKSGKTVVNLNLDDISFIEAGKKGPIIHLPDRTVLVTRTTLQAVFDRLVQADSSFMKAGGSFIVNLENMRTASDASAIFGDGSTIILPTRLRKPVAEALNANRLRAEKPSEAQLAAS